MPDRRWYLMVILAAVLFLAGTLLGVGLGLASHPAANIGGTNVRFGLHCQEDEVIGFIGPNTLACVHNERGVLDG